MAKAETVQVDAELDQALLGVQRAAEDLVTEAQEYTRSTFRGGVQLGYFIPKDVFLQLEEALALVHRRAEAIAFGARVSDGPPYDAATATGMYDHD
jgi:hypothetical protein